MADDRQPKAEGDRPVTPELAATEIAEGGGQRTRTGPRVIDRHAEPRARVVGRFRIDAQLGSGGMGDVFRAYDTVLDRAVALKILRTDHAADDAQRMRRVVREARAAAALVHHDERSDRPPERDRDRTRHRLLVARGRQDRPHRARGLQDSVND